MTPFVQYFTISLLLLICSFDTVNAQSLKGADEISSIEVNVIELTDMAGVIQGYTIPPPNSPCISETERASIRAIVNQNKEAIKAVKGDIFQSSLFKVADEYFDFPLQSAAGYPECGSHYVSAYVDHDPAPNSAVDYACGNLTYDTPTYNHQGTDFAIHPYPWHIMENDWVEVVAAAAGIITYRADGNYDQNCTPNADPANMIIIQHASGTETWYAHMKSGSLTSKLIGQSVVAGEYLGVVGSSGNSTGPHMHFEVRDVNDNVIDPFYNEGGTSCNASTNETWWNNQYPYHDSYINAVKVHSAPPEFSTCNNLAITNEATAFNAGSTVYLGLYIRHQEYGQTYVVNVTRPNGTTLYTYNLVSPSPFLSNAFWYFTINFTENTMLGVYTMSAEYNGQTCQQPFEMVAVGAPTPTVGQWSLISMTLMFLSMGIVLIEEERKDLLQEKFSS